MAAQQPGGWAEVEAAVREAVQDWRPGQGETILGRTLAALRPAWERHAAELAAARRDLEDPKVHELWHRTGLAEARAELAAAGAREAGLREALLRGWCCANWRGEELDPEDLPLHSGDCPLAAAPAPAGGLLGLLNDLERGERSRTPREVAASLRFHIGLPAREGA
jgi:hypothetical protein